MKSLRRSKRSSNYPSRNSQRRQTHKTVTMARNWSQLIIPQKFKHGRQGTRDAVRSISSHCEKGSDDACFSLQGPGATNMVYVSPVILLTPNMINVVLIRAPIIPGGDWKLVADIKMRPYLTGTQQANWKWIDYRYYQNLLQWRWPRKWTLYY